MLDFTKEVKRKGEKMKTKFYVRMEFYEIDKEQKDRLTDEIYELLISLDFEENDYDLTILDEEE